MSKLRISGAMFALALAAAGANADTLPLPQNLTGLSTRHGEVVLCRERRAGGLLPARQQFPDPEDPVLLRRRLGS